MTETAIGDRAGITARLPAWARRWQRRVSARLYEAGDERARRRGWTATKTPMRFALEARRYRDPRFDDRRQRLVLPAGALRTCKGAAPTTEAGE